MTIPTVTDDLLAEIEEEFSRNGPCPHHLYEKIGSSHYIKCHDCGATIGMDMLERAQKASKRHDELSAALHEQFANIRQLERDAARYQGMRAVVMAEREGCTAALYDEECDRLLDKYAAMQGDL